MNNQSGQKLTEYDAKEIICLASKGEMTSALASRFADHNRLHARHSSGANRMTLHWYREGWEWQN